MFTTEQLSEMFRTGTLNGAPVYRSGITRTHNARAQFDKVTVTVSNTKYEITRIFPFDENRKQTMPEKGLPEIIVYYEITQL